MHFITANMATVGGGAQRLKSRKVMETGRTQKGLFLLDEVLRGKAAAVGPHGRAGGTAADIRRAGSAMIGCSGSNQARLARTHGE
jgi:hypothetical protein